MMKNFVFKNLVATCVAGIAISLTPKASVAQVDKSLLTEVASSCQQDVLSTEYYQQLGHQKGFIPGDYYEDDLLRKCITSRYFYSLVLYKFSWLASTEEMLPGYPGSVAVAQLANRSGSGNGSDVIDCLASQDKSSEECTNSYTFEALYSGDIDNSDRLTKYHTYGYMCPSCYATYNDYPSGRKMIGAFIEWFMGLEPSHRKELVSILGDEQTQLKNVDIIKREADRAWYEYKEIRERIAEEEKEQRRRELFE